MKKILLGFLLISQISYGADFSVQFSPEDNSISSAKIQDSAVTASKIAPLSIDDSKVSSLSSSKISDLSSTMEAAIANYISNKAVSLRYTQSNGQAIPTGVRTTITFNNNEWDNKNAFNGATGVFTAPTSGIYRISTSVMFAVSTWGVGSGTFLDLYKNGVAIASSPDKYVQDGFNNHFAPDSIQTTVKLLQGETLKVSVYHSRGGSTPLYTSGQFNYISIDRIGEY